MIVYDRKTGGAALELSLPQRSLAQNVSKLLFSVLVLSVLCLDFIYFAVGFIVSSFP